MAPSTIVHCGCRVAVMLTSCSRSFGGRHGRQRHWNTGGSLSLPRKFCEFFISKWCPMVHYACVAFKIHECGVQKSRWREKNKTFVKILGGCRHRTTPAGQILGFATPAVLNIPSALVAAQFSLSDQWRFVFRLVSRADKMSSGIVTAVRLTDTCECRLVRWTQLLKLKFSQSKVVKVICPTSALYRAHYLLTTA